MNRRQALDIVRQFEYDPKLNHLVAALVKLQEGQPIQKYTESIKALTILLTNLQEFDKIHTRILANQKAENDEAGRDFRTMAERQSDKD